MLVNSGTLQDLHLVVEALARVKRQLSVSFTSRAGFVALIVAIALAKILISASVPAGKDLADIISLSASIERPLNGPWTAFTSAWLGLLPPSQLALAI